MLTFSKSLDNCTPACYHDNMKKMLALVLVCSLLLLLFSNVAIVRVVKERANFHYNVKDASQFDAIEEGTYLIIFGCAPHQWREALTIRNHGYINLTDVIIILGTLPDCEYSGEKPPSGQPKGIIF